MSYTVIALVVADIRVFQGGKHPVVRHEPVDPPVISDRAMEIVRKYAGGDALHLGGGDIRLVPYELCDTATDEEWLAVRDVARLYKWAVRWTHNIESGAIELGPATS